MATGNPKIIQMCVDKTLPLVGHKEAFIKVRQRPSDNYIDVLVIAKISGKSYKNWRKSNDIDGYVQALKLHEKQLIEVRNNSIFMHPLIAGQFALWCGAYYGVQVMDWLFQPITRENVLIMHDLERQKMRIAILEHKVAKLLGEE